MKCGLWQTANYIYFLNIFHIIILSFWQGSRCVFLWPLLLHLNDGPWWGLLCDVFINYHYRTVVIPTFIVPVSKWNCIQCVSWACTDRAAIYVYRVRGTRSTFLAWHPPASLSTKTRPKLATTSGMYGDSEKCME